MDIRKFGDRLVRLSELENFCSAEIKCSEMIVFSDSACLLRIGHEMLIVRDLSYSSNHNDRERYSR